METTLTQPTQIKEFYDRVLLARVRPLVVHGQFGQPKPIPANSGKTVSWRRFASLAAATTPLVEGVTPAGSALSSSEINATVAQYGSFVTLTDMLQAISINDMGQQTVEQLGDQAALTLDTVIRDALTAGTNVAYADAVANRAAVAAANVIDWNLVKFAATQLANASASRIGQQYVGIIHPFAKHTLTNDNKWIEAAKYAGSMPLYSGEIGQIQGVRFIESPLARVYAGAGAGAIDVYATLVMGANAYGLISLANMGLESIFKPLGSGDDPLNQRATWAWKATQAARILNESWIIRLEHSIAVTA